MNGVNDEALQPQRRSTDCLQALFAYHLLERTFRPAIEECRLIDWVEQAVNLRGKFPIKLAFAIGQLAMEYGRTKRLPITERWIRENTFRRVSVCRALKALESAGLLTVARCNGRSPLVSIVEIDARRPDRRSN